MLQLLAPRQYIASIHALHPAELAVSGISGLIVDLDNTLTPWQGGRPDDERLADLVGAFAKVEIGVCIVSNNRGPRVAAFGAALRIPVVAGALKPRRQPFRQAMDLLGTGPSQTAVVGDQIFTDILGGNRLGLYTILVQPMSPREFIGTRVVRKVEGLVLAALARRGLLGQPAAISKNPASMPGHGLPAGLDE